jgi:hypothetical protein
MFLTYDALRSACIARNDSTAGVRTRCWVTGLVTPSQTPVTQMCSAVPADKPAICFCRISFLDILILMLSPATLLLGQGRYVHIYLPPTYDGVTQFPVWVHLHGEHAASGRIPSCMLDVHKTRRHVRLVLQLERGACSQ